MKILNIQLCDLVIWTKRCILVLTFKFDVDYWKSLILPKLSIFFFKNYIPELVCSF